MSSDGMIIYENLFSSLLQLVGLGEETSPSHHPTAKQIQSKAIAYLKASPTNTNTIHFNIRKAFVDCAEVVNDTYNISDGKSNKSVTSKSRIKGLSQENREDEGVDWNDTKEVKKKRKAFLDLFFSLYEVVKGVGQMIKEPTSAARLEVYQGYEQTFVQIVPLITKFGGDRGEGLLSIGEKHSNPVQKVLKNLKTSKLVRPDLCDVWLKQLALQEGFKTSDVINDSFNVFSSDKSFSPNVPSAASSSVHSEVSTSSWESDENYSTSVTGVTKLRPVPPRVRHTSTFAVASPAQPPTSLWRFRIEACKVIQSIFYAITTRNSGSASEGGNMSILGLHTAYYVCHQLVQYGRFKEEDVVSISLACIVLGSKVADDYTLRIAKLIINEGVKDALSETLPDYATLPTNNELKLEFPPQDPSVTLKHPPTFVYRNSCVWTTKDQPTREGPVALPSLIGAYEFHILGLFSFHIDVKNPNKPIFPHAAANLAKLEKKLDVKDKDVAVLQRILNDPGYAYSGLVLLNEPMTCLAAAVSVMANKTDNKSSLSSDWCDRIRVDKGLVEMVRRQMNYTHDLAKVLGEREREKAAGMSPNSDESTPTFDGSQSPPSDDVESNSTIDAVRNGFEELAHQFEVKREEKEKRASTRDRGRSASEPAKDRHRSSSSRDGGSHRSGSSRDGESSSRRSSSSKDRDRDRDRDRDSSRSSSSRDRDGDYRRSSSKDRGRDRDRDDDRNRYRDRDRDRNRDSRHRSSSSRDRDRDRDGDSRSDSRSRSQSQPQSSHHSSQTSTTTTSSQYSNSPAVGLSEDSQMRLPDDIQAKLLQRKRDRQEDLEAENRKKSEKSEKRSRWDRGASGR